MLVVDDEEAILNVYQSALTRLGYEVTLASGGIEALALFRADPDSFDLVLTDQMMPRGTGGELAQAVLASHPSLPVVLCTGRPDSMPAQTAAEIGIREVLRKPFSIRTLAQVVRRALHQTDSPHRPARQSTGERRD